MAFSDGPFENLKVPLVWTAAVVVVVALIASIALILGDRGQARAETPYGPIRSGVAEAAAPVGGVLSAPVRWFGAAGRGISGYFFAVSENRRLRAEIVELKAWRDEALAMKNVNARYEAMLGVRTDPPVPMATGVTVSESRGPFKNTRLVDVGTAKGVRIGNPVINEHGLVGRIIGATGGVSRVLMVTDVASRTPVLIDRSDARALLTGDGSANPRLAFVREGASVQAGDRVMTSGDGGGYPRGVPVGVVARGLDGTWRVKLFSDRGAIDYVRVMLFQDFGQLASPEALNAPPLAGLGAAPAPDAAQSAAIADVAVRRAAAASAAAERVRAANAAPPPTPTPVSPSPDVAPVAASPAAEPTPPAPQPAPATATAQPEAPQ